MTMNKANILNILRSNASVFTFKDILLATNEAKPLLLKRRLSYYIKQGELYHIRRGFYAKDKNYNRLELATKILTPSYVSFETVLKQEGIIFQYYSTIFVASYQTKEITCDGQLYSFKKIKDTILTNNAGIENKGTYSVASKERAFLDTLYLNKDYHFDNLSSLNFDRVLALLPIYHNQRMTKRVNAYFKEFHANRKPLMMLDAAQHKHIPVQNAIENTLAALKKTKEIIYYAIQLNDAINQGEIKPVQLEKKLVIQEPNADAIVIDLDWTQNLIAFKETSDDAMTLTISSAIITCKESYAKILWVKDEQEKESPDLYAAQTIQKLIRDALGHMCVREKDFAAPYWDIPNKHRRIFEIKSLGIIFDAHNLHDKQFRWSHVGGLSNFLKILIYLINDIDRED